MAVLVHGFGDSGQKILFVHRFQKIVYAGQAHGFGDILEFGIGGQEDTDGIKPVLPDMVQKLQAASAGHFDIQDHNGDSMAGKIFQRLRHAVSAVNFIEGRAVLCDLHPCALCTVVFIIHDQQIHRGFLSADPEAALCIVVCWALLSTECRQDARIMLILVTVQPTMSLS